VAQQGTMGAGSGDHGRIGAGAGAGAGNLFANQEDGGLAQSTAEHAPWPILTPPPSALHAYPPHMRIAPAQHPATHNCTPTVTHDYVDFTIVIQQQNTRCLPHLEARNMAHVLQNI